MLRCIFFGPYHELAQSCGMFVAPSLVEHLNLTSKVNVDLGLKNIAGFHFSHTKSARCGRIS